MCGFVCGKVVEVVGYYAVEEVFASYCNQSAAPLGVFGVVVPPAMNLLPRVSRKLSKSSLAMECLGGQYTAEVVIVP